jgi:hypothetical protein
MKAKYCLKEVFQAIHQRHVWFSARSRSTYQVVQVFEGSATPKSLEAADQYIQETILKLTEAHFKGTVSMWGDPKDLADKYGISDSGHDWYIKFQIDDEGTLVEISFHLSDRNFVTMGGIKICKGV